MSEARSPGVSWTAVSVVLGLVMSMTLGGATAFWAVFQTQFSAADHARLELKSELDRVRDALDRLSPVKREEHAEFAKRLDNEFHGIAERLKILETTRPTTGELDKASKSSDNQISEVKERVRSLEDYIRTPRPLGQAAPTAR